MNTENASCDRLISTEEFCKIVGTGRSYLYKELIKHFSVVKQGRRTLLSEAEAHKFVADKVQAARNAKTP